MDKRNVILAILLAVNAVTLIAVFVTLVSQPPEADEPEGEDRTTLLERISKLEADVEELKSAPRIRTARTGNVDKRASASPTPPAGKAGLIELAEREAEAEEVVANVLDAPDGEARGKVEEIITAKMEAERDKRRAARNARRKARVIERTKEFAANNNLGADQERKLTDLLTREQEDLRDFRRQAREDMNFEMAREQSEALREETDREAEEILDEEQFEAYKKERQEDDRRGRRRGR